MKLACPTCKNQTTWEENPWKPFCSERCKLIDLGTWASGEYRIPGTAPVRTGNDGPSREAGQEITPFGRIQEDS